MIRIMDAKSELLDTIVARLTTVARPARVIVFGSAATGTATTDSDIDLLILLDEVDDARLESVRLRRALRSVGMPLDVIVMRTDRFEETKNVVGGIAYPANKYGRVIYKAASRGGSVTGRLRRPSRMPRSSRHTAWSIAIPGSMRRSRRTPPIRACRLRARSTSRSLGACPRMLGSSHARGPARSCASLRKRFVVARRRGTTPDNASVPAAA